MSSDHPRINSPSSADNVTRTSNSKLISNCDKSPPRMARTPLSPSKQQTSQPHQLASPLGKRARLSAPSLPLNIARDQGVAIARTQNVPISKDIRLTQKLLPFQPVNTSTNVTGSTSSSSTLIPITTKSSRKKSTGSLPTSFKQTLLSLGSENTTKSIPLTAKRQRISGDTDKEIPSLPSGPRPLAPDRQPQRSPERITPRLVNLGNTCFINAAIVKTIGNPIIRPLLYQCLQPGVQAHSEMQSIAQLLAALLTRASAASVTPTSLCEAIWRLDNRATYPRSSQGDSALPERHFVEGILAITSGIHGILPPTNLNVDDERTFLGTQAHNAFSKFDVRFSTWKKCLNSTCARESVSFDRRLSLELGVPRSSDEPLSLQDMLLRFDTPVLNHDYDCEQCHQKEHHFSDRITVLPETILLSLNRFHQENGSGQLLKISTSVSVPASLNIKAVRTGDNAVLTATYVVMSITSHFGASLTEGHYICHNHWADGWYSHNDVSVDPLTLGQELMTGRTFM